NVDDRYRSVLRIGGPKLRAVRCDIETFIAVADGNDCFVPIRPASLGFVNDADGAGGDIGSEDLLHIWGHIDHVGPVLASAQNPIDLAGRRIVAPNRL